jgi:hypothetical protein
MSDRDNFGAFLVGFLVAELPAQCRQPVVCSRILVKRDSHGY